ncbi:MAG: elongation factor P maturation arginine rhamnosyltransferase EarP [Treponema sp.]|nr:elongation factor P maturation arginine rhamnosyltransferase EarP [Candidatus Treponema caballi]
MKTDNITLLCKVVDNFGDIGVVWRLARAISDLDAADFSGAESAGKTDDAFKACDADKAFVPFKACRRLVVDDLTAFKNLVPSIDLAAPVQQIGGWTVLRSDAADECRASFLETPPLVILECFACGRPDWLEHLLFDEGFPHTVQIINLEYLTAEPYADEFHKLLSLTRKKSVQKVNFMPGFTPQTGGLILDDAFMRSLGGTKANDAFTTVVFAYERDFSTVAGALDRFARERDAAGKGRVLVRSAAGKSARPFADAAAVKADTSFVSPSNSEKAPLSFGLEQLPFMTQLAWDEMLCSSDFLFIRGEDSLSRACLSGHPFVWHAYPQSENYQLVKVQALLDRMEPFFSPEDYQLIRDYWRWYNNADMPGYDSEEALYQILVRYEEMAVSFGNFSKMLIKNGNLAAHLMTFINEIV